MAYPKYTLTGKTPAQTYENLVQFNVESSSLVNGDGNDITASLNLTVANAVSASYASNGGGGSVQEPIYLSNASNFYTTTGVGVGDVLLSFHDTTVGDSGSAFIGIGSGHPSAGDRCLTEIFADSDFNFAGIYFQNLQSAVFHTVKLNTSEGLVFNNGAGNTATINMNGQANFNSITGAFIGNLQGTASNAAGAISNTTITVHSQDNVNILATNTVNLSATGAMYLEAGTDITVTPRSALIIDGDLSVVGHVNSPIILSGSSSPTIAFLSSLGYNPGDVHGFLGFNGKYSSSDNGFAESARIEGVKDATDGTSGGALVFYTSNASFTVIERARIDTTGNLSLTTGEFIGTSSYAHGLAPAAGLTTVVHLTASVTTMSFVNGLLQSVS